MSRLMPVKSIDVPRGALVWVQPHPGGPLYQGNLIRCTHSGLRLIQTHHGTWTTSEVHAIYRKES